MRNELRLADYVFIVGVGFTLTVPPILAVCVSTGTATVAAGCGAFVTFMARIESVAEFSLWFVKAKMHKTIAKANVTIDQLRSIAHSVGKAVLSDSMAANFTVGTAIENRLRFHDKLMDSLREVGLSERELSDVTELWDRGIGMLFSMAIQNRLAGGIWHDSSKHKNYTNDFESKYHALSDIGTWKSPTPEELTDFITSHQMMTEEVGKLLDDYRHFVRTGQLRRMDVFHCLDYQPQPKRA